MNQLFWMRLLLPVMGRFPGLFYRAAAPIAWAAWHIRPDLRRNVIRNLRPLCDGDHARTRREARESLRNVARYWVDLATLPHRRMGSFEATHLRLVNGERLEVLDCGGPVLIVSAHTGNPELCVQALTHRGRPFLAMVEALRPLAVANYMLRLRSAAGGHFVEADLGGVRSALQALRDGGIVGIICDRDIRSTGVCVTICGNAVRLPRGPWELARRTGATVLPIFAARERHEDHTVFVEEPFRVPATADEDGDVERAVNRWAAMLERHLRREPGQWTVLEDFWKVHRCG